MSYDFDKSGILILTSRSLVGTTGILVLTQCYTRNRSWTLTRRSSSSMDFLAGGMTSAMVRTVDTARAFESRAYCKYSGSGGILYLNRKQNQS
ncbi:uncharacterized protein N7483_004683 [Penicillium malachiteum]|uniref:uncharacterized protein n=1 Tax=Penicillium malachiteum TaxID=1324776 RepID=UPI002547B82B|nr:uncharacterized protein N7483_004683 [Penicillium malachiteum]KAJ5730175.1 hypothetical protein N7483_004683 [Penicillium malachiteum]